MGFGSSGYCCRGQLGLLSGFRRLQFRNDLADLHRRPFINKCLYHTIYLGGNLSSHFVCFNFRYCFSRADKIPRFFYPATEKT